MIRSKRWLTLPINLITRWWLWWWMSSDTLIHKFVSCRVLRCYLLQGEKKASLTWNRVLHVPYQYNWPINLSVDALMEIIFYRKYRYIKDKTTFHNICYLFWVISESQYSAALSNITCFLDIKQLCVKGPCYTRVGYKLCHKGFLCIHKYLYRQFKMNEYTVIHCLCFKLYCDILGLCYK